MTTLGLGLGLMVLACFLDHPPGRSDWRGPAGGIAAVVGVLILFGGLIWAS